MHFAFLMMLATPIMTVMGQLPVFFCPELGFDGHCTTPELEFELCQAIPENILNGSSFPFGSAKV